MAWHMRSIMQYTKTYDCACYCTEVDSKTAVLCAPEHSFKQ